MASVATRHKYIGERVARREDFKLLTGQGQYVDNLVLPGMAWVAVVRSPYAHARIRNIDLAEALAQDGVIAAFDGEAIARELTTPLLCIWRVTDDALMPEHWPLARDKARYAGDGVAVVVAETREAAKNAAELVSVDYEPLSSVTDVEVAWREDAPLVHEQFGTNRAYTWSLRTGDVERCFAEAAVTVKQRYRQQRLIPSAIEPRGVVVQPLPAVGEYVVWSSTQVPHILHVALAEIVGIPENKLRIIAPDVGGGFGSKLDVYAEEALCLALARRLERPVKWIAERSEDFVSTVHGRDQIQEIELAATSEGRITAVRTHLMVGMGAYLQFATPGIPLLGAWLYGGCYEVPAHSFECQGVFTNATPTGAYRGAGRPEAAYAIERAIDALARKLGKDPVEIRRLNFITEFPYEVPPAASLGITIDSGDYHASLDRALSILNYEAVCRDRDERRQREDTRQLGIGFSTYYELAGHAPSRIFGAFGFAGSGWESATIRFLPTGTVQILSGISPHGQGLVTSFCQIAAERLGVDLEDVEILHGDTAIVPYGRDTYGSRSLVIGGTALCYAADKLIAKARRIVSHHFEAHEDDLQFAEGRFTVRGSPSVSMTIKDVARIAYLAHDLPQGVEPVLEAHYVHDPQDFSWPAGCHIAVVEVDTETGKVDLIRYIAVDDCGQVVNPTIVEGQIHGGIAQGVAQALFEEAIYDEQGNLVTSSFLTYSVPSAADLPLFELGRTVSASTTNPLGAKGVGEAGTIGSPPAVMNAILDALAPLGVGHLDMPASPERVWRAIEEARK